MTINGIPDQPRWGLLAALAWSASRSFDFVAANFGETQLSRLQVSLLRFQQERAETEVGSNSKAWKQHVEAFWRAGAHGPPNPLSFTDALFSEATNRNEIANLTQALAAGLIAWGVRAHGPDAGRTVQIPSVEWDELKPGDADTACTDMVEYRGVRIERAALLTAFPPEGHLPAKIMLATETEATSGPQGLGRSVQPLVTAAWKKWGGPPPGFTSRSAQHDAIWKAAQKIQPELEKADRPSEDSFDRAIAALKNHVS